MFRSNRESRDTDTVRRDAASTGGDTVLREDSEYRRVATESVAESRRPASDQASRMPETASVFANALDESAGPICTAGRSLWRLLTIWGEKVGLAVVLTTAAIGFSRFASHASRPGPELEINNRPDGGFVVRREVRRLWLPEALSRLAKPQARSPLIRDHEELRQFLELQNLEDLCYALTIRMHQVNGEFAEITFIRHPYDEFHYFPELMDVLATAAGNPPPHSDAFEGDFSTASVQVIPEKSWKRGFREFMVEQLSHPSPPGDQEHDP
jgi:hypothetical protein